jgi:hypothetical protein
MQLLDDGLEVVALEEYCLTLPAEVQVIAYLMAPNMRLAK